MRRYLPGIIISSLVILIIGYGGSVIQQHRRLRSSPVSVTVRTTDPMLGPRNAPVTIVEFGDFQCESCKDFHVELEKVRQRYGNRVRVVWKDFPLVAQHPDAYMAAQAARCAQDQGKFWEMHEQLFAHQADLPGRDFTALAKAIEINTESFDRCLRDGLANSRIDEGLSDGQALGVLATPTVIVNSLRFSGIPTAEEIGRAVDQSLQQ
jgi:protein-disulfide isomerase